MKKYWPFIFWVVFISFFLTFFKETEAVQLQSTQLQIYLRQGIEKALNLEMQNAINYLQKAVELDQENPMPYAFLTLSYLSSYEMSFEPREREKYQQSMMYYVSEALVRGGKRIEKNSKDAQAYFAMALAKFAKVRWAMEQKRYFIVMYETSYIWDYCERAKRENPLNYDIYFPVGLIHYHLDHLSNLTRFISKILITSGDRQKGLQELEMAAQKGYLFKELALAELILVYANFEHQPDRALPFAQKLRESFPNNYNFSFVLANILSDLHRFEEAFAIAREIERSILAGKPPYGPKIQSRYDLLMGRIFFEQGEYARAAEYFQLSLKDNSPYNARSRAWALLRLGMIHDLNKERKKALDCYASVLEIAGGEGVAQLEAKKYLRIPYVPIPKLKAS